jgi:hypothetical protein
VSSRESGDRSDEASASWNLGLVLERQSELARAAELMQVLVDHFREIRHSDAEKYAARLGQLRQRLAAAQVPPPAESTDEA